MREQVFENCKCFPVMPTLAQQVNHLRTFAAQDFLTASQHVDRKGGFGVVDVTVERGKGGPVFFLHCIVCCCPDNFVACAEHL